MVETTLTAMVETTNVARKGEESRTDIRLLMKTVIQRKWHNTLVGWGMSAIPQSSQLASWALFYLFQELHQYSRISLGFSKRWLIQLSFFSLLLIHFGERYDRIKMRFKWIHSFTSTYSPLEETQKNDFTSYTQFCYYHYMKRTIPYHIKSNQSLLII